MTRRIDVNCDIGETSLPWYESHEPDLMATITSANVACGGHAGDDASMREVCGEARRLGVRVGAQVSYPDRERFGRVALEIEPHLLAGSLDAQFEALAQAAASESVRVTYVKPHGALYNVVVTHDDHARVVVDLASRYGIALFGLAGSVTERLAHAAGVHFIPEWFADRGYLDDGRLAPRSHPAALVISDEEIHERVLQAVGDGTVRSVDGRVVHVTFDTVCVHSDTPNAASLLRAVRRAMDGLGVIAEAT